MRSVQLLFCAAVLGLGAAIPAGAAIQFTPAQPNVDQAVTFSLTASFGLIQPGSIVWTFGDGTSASGQTVVQKIYASAGSFTVTAQYSVTTLGTNMPTRVTDTVTVGVVERRRITFTPSAPLIQQAVAFTAENFFSPAVRWDFGDGTPPQSAGTRVTHVYAVPGDYIVGAKDNGGAGLATIRALVSVGVDVSRRRIAFSPGAPVAAGPVVFTAVDFFTAQIRWDFGDGTAPLSGSTTAIHAFAYPGLYRVRAWDWDGRAGAPTTADVRVSEPSGARASFRISYLQVRFEDGLAYKVVAERSPSLVAFADIKYEGTGLLQAQWTLDGMPFRSVSRTLAFADSITIDSGSVPGLPTLATGIHEVGLRLLQPEADFTVPVIRYFVAAGTSLPPVRELDVRVESAKGLKGVAAELTGSDLAAPFGSLLILSGTIRCDFSEPVKTALLRVHVGAELADQQIFKDLKPGDVRAFKTSFLYAGPESQAVTLTLTDIGTPRAPRLLVLKKLIVSPQR